MPRGDMTGPMGQGPVTGRGAGRCAGAARPGFAFGGGRGFGRGFGPGRRAGWAGPGAMAPGWGRAFVTRADARQGLEAYREELKRELAGVEEELGKAEPEKE